MPNKRSNISKTYNHKFFKSIEKFLFADKVNYKIYKPKTYKKTILNPIHL